MRLLFILKFLLVGGLLAAGTFFLLNGLGVNIPFLEYKGLEAHGVPAGVILLGAGIALAKFWKIEVIESMPPPEVIESKPSSEVNESKPKPRSSGGGGAWRKATFDKIRRDW